MGFLAGVAFRAAGFRAAGLRAQGLGRRKSEAVQKTKQFTRIGFGCLRKLNDIST